MNRTTTFYGMHSYFIQKITISKGKYDFIIQVSSNCWTSFLCLLSHIAKKTNN
jgi:hypothetical protein